MGARGLSLDFSDFSGGLNTYDPEINTPINQAADLDNLVLLSKGFKSRQGDVTWNATPMVSGATPVHGLGYVKLDNGTEYLTAVTGTKFFSDTGLSGTMTDKTGAVTITAGQDNIWTPLVYGNIQIWFGGSPTSLEAPFKYSGGSGNIAALGGSPPAAATGFVANNRVFAISTNADPSGIFWPVLANPEDWTGAGSGTSDVSASDGEALQCGVVLGTDTAILFKNSSTHLMVLTSQPFPIYQLQKGIGIAGRNAWAISNGTIYFVTPGRRMRSTTDGINFETFPNDINDIWDSINPTRIANIQGFYYQTLEWIVFFVATGSSTTNNLAIIWDLQRKCWLRCSTGYNGNVFALIQNRRMFAGHYNGKIYEKDKVGARSDASETAPGAINAYWRTPFASNSTYSPQEARLTAPFAQTIHPLWLDLAFVAETSTVMEISYGFDFSFPRTVTNQSIVAGTSLWDQALWDVGTWGGQTSVIPRVFTRGRGNFFSVRIRNAVATQGFTFQGLSVQLRTDKARKLLNVT